ncbi:cupin-like domain-containing protein [Aurantiacibacter hainanensis]|uniref:cupin-like domain-containing protein n=1 Tax=Aurantiacibacter hainanensis TaxID=3076114 RepID=UPI0030C75C3E
MPEIAEYDQPDAATFSATIYPKAEPAILRGVGALLEPVRLAKRSTREFGDYLKQAIGDRQIDVLAAKPDAGSTFFFEDSVTAFNFERGQMPFTSFVDQILDASGEGRMLYLESTKIADLSPALAQSMHLPIVPPTVAPRIWMGNRTGTQTHFDIKQNIAYVVSGKRRFTLFPPSQTPNLYMAPFESSPSGAPISMVRLDDPDFETFPRFREALASSMTADLEPGDALFIPYMWWHHVAARGELNVLVNYWWNEHDALGSPLDAMLHSILAVRDLPPPMRAAWQTMFETYVFKSHGEPMEHIEPSKRGGLGPLDPRMRVQLWQSLGSGLSKTMERVFKQRF